VKKPLFLVVVVALAAPGTAAAAHQSGIVVKADVNAHLVVVAQRAGKVVRVHAPAGRFARNRTRFRVGQRISFTGRKLRNGTLAGSGFRIIGHARRVRVHGIVRAYDRRKQRITLAAGGALLRMRLAGAGARTLLASAPPPKVGDEVTVTASVDENDDVLEATELEDEQQAGDEQQAEDNDQQAEQDDQGTDVSADDSSSDDDSSDGSGSGDDESGD
jgi:hypothetical protein